MKALQQPPWSTQLALGQPLSTQLPDQPSCRMPLLSHVGRSLLRQQQHQKVSEARGVPGHNKGPGVMSHQSPEWNQQQMAP